MEKAKGSSRAEDVGFVVILAGSLAAVVVPVAILARQVAQYLMNGSWVSLPFRETLLACC
jgi:hypothetical protein